MDTLTFEQPTTTVQAPARFNKRADGIYAFKADGQENGVTKYREVFVCGPLEVAAIVRDVQTDAYYRVLRINTIRQDRKEVLIPD